VSKLTDEQTKLTANWLNATASGVMITGVVAPAVAAYFNIPGPSQAGLVAIIFGSAIWLLIGFGLHSWARVLLRKLDP
jgi:hypothetical protein